MSEDYTEPDPEWDDKNDDMDEIQEYDKLNFCSCCDINPCMKCQRKDPCEHKHVCYGCCSGAGEVYK